MISSVHVATAHRDDVYIACVGAKDRHYRVMPEIVAKKFRCELETAQRTLETTTQCGVCHSLHPLHRRYRVDHLNLHRKRLHNMFYMDILFSKVKSLGGYTCAQLITNGTFTKVYPISYMPYTLGVIGVFHCKVTIKKVFLEFPLKKSRKSEFWVAYQINLVMV